MKLRSSPVLFLLPPRWASPRWCSLHSGGLAGRQADHQGHLPHMRGKQVGQAALPLTPP